jgi:hypothetical protein
MKAMKIAAIFGLAAMFAGCSVPEGVEIVKEAPGIKEVLVSRLELTGYIAAPQEGDTPAGSFVVQDQYYAEKVTWYYTVDGNDIQLAAGDKFQQGNAYTALFTLKALPGKTFTGLEANTLTYRDAEVKHGGGEGGTLTVTIVFNGAQARVEESAAYMTVYAYSGVNGKVTIQAALDMVEYAYQNTVNPWPGKEAGNPASAEVVLLDKITVNSNSLINISGEGKYPPLILRAQDPAKGGEGDITLPDDADGVLLTVRDGGTLTLRDITLKGRGKGECNTDSLVKVNNGGNLTIADNAVIRDNRTAGSGGGVYVGKSGTFTMSGGEIRDNHADRFGGGVYVDAGGMFTMSGGEIRDNVADSFGGGVCIFVNGMFAKTGGTIYGKSESDNSNTTGKNGHAACVIDGITTFQKKCDSTAGKDATGVMYWNYTGKAKEGWDW